MKDHWENDEKMMRENTREPVVSFLILPGVTSSRTIMGGCASFWGLLAIIFTFFIHSVNLILKPLNIASSVNRSERALYLS